MVKFGVLASEELKIIGRLLTYKYRNSQGLDAREFSDVVDMLNVTVNGESFNASHFSNNDAVGSLDSKDTERKTVRLCYGTDPELFVIQVIDNLINTTGNERLKKWLNGLPGKKPTLTCSLNGLYTSQHSLDQAVHVDFPSSKTSKYLTILFNFECGSDVEGMAGTMTTRKSTIFVEAETKHKRKPACVDDDGQALQLAQAEGVAFDGNELHYGCGSFERIALLAVLNASSQNDENLDTKIANEMTCNWFKDTERLARDKNTTESVMGKEELAKKMLMPYVTGAGTARERFKWPRRLVVAGCMECQET